ncbi:hypothetical protein [Selenomonas ruminantium]|uniref:Uncharacterized protein n=1 Tax=Selenomonas ruminantium TaxID=971 RepID=A0A1H0PQ07_SELRU|nr:hypothetical protein [Selenomonas ruminantium]SDP06735.1 hypothetical protein SAMN05216366_105122 [Selenomonas ruminantium]
MKILIIAFHDREIEPYAVMYEKIAKESDVDYDIFLWDRFSDNSLEIKDNEYIFHKICTMGGDKLKKIPAFYCFRSVLKKIITNNCYKKIIVLNTMPGVLLADLLLNEYKNNFIYDIRDYTYEKYFIYKWLVRKLIANSAFTTISSPGFIKFLGYSEKFVNNHNISNEADRFAHSTILNKEKIIIGFVGAIRYYEENTALLDCLKNNDKYSFVYMGRRYPECDLFTYCQEKKIKNVSFKGAFSNNEKPVIYRGIDIINAVYGNKKNEVKTALPNKLYDAIIFKKPIMVSSDTYLADVVEKYRIGFSVDVIRDNFKDKLDKYLQSFNAEEFEHNADSLLEKVMREQNEFKKYVKETLLKIK